MIVDLAPAFYLVTFLAEFTREVQRGAQTLLNKETKEVWTVVEQESFPDADQLWEVGLELAVRVSREIGLAVTTALPQVIALPISEECAYVAVNNRKLKANFSPHAFQADIVANPEQVGGEIWLPPGRLFAIRMEGIKRGHYYLLRMPATDTFLKVLFDDTIAWLMSASLTEVRFALK